jgi:hypothetical protein
MNMNTVKDQNCSHEEITKRLNSVNGCYNSVHSLYSSHILTFFSMSLSARSGPWPLIQFRNHFSQTVRLLA